MNVTTASSPAPALGLRLVCWILFGFLLLIRPVVVFVCWAISVLASITAVVCLVGVFRHPGVVLELLATVLLFSVIPRAHALLLAMLSRHC